MYYYWFGIDYFLILLKNKLSRNIVVPRKDKIITIVLKQIPKVHFKKNKKKKLFFWVYIVFMLNE